MNPFFFLLQDPPQKENDILYDIIKIFKKCNKRSGSICSDIGFIASGKIECYIFLSSNPNLVNQVSLILSETGGVLNVLDFDKKIYIK